MEAKRDTRPKSRDLRMCIVNKIKEGKWSKKKIAETYEVHRATVYRIWNQYRKTDTVDPKTPEPHPKPLLNAQAQNQIRKYYGEISGRFYREIQEMLVEDGFPKVSLCTICKTVKKMGYTRKKKQYYPSEQKQKAVREEYRIFCEDEACIPLTACIFVDEAGFLTNLTCAYGYGPRGRRIKDDRPLHRSRHNLILAILGNKIVASRIVTGTVNGEVFGAFLQEDLAPFLNPGITLYLDNAKFHKDPVPGSKRKKGGEPFKISSYLAEKGVRIRYLPRYHPEKNPVELIFWKVRHILSVLEPRAKGFLDYCIGIALEAITQEDIEGFIRHAGYKEKGGSVASGS